jgi:3-hydroxyacyl-[acyl-carrier-protein] dehydratase
MLNNDFFHIVSLDEGAGTLRAVIRINPDHHIFEGHFPGQPVVPGVCMIQIVKELLATVTGEEPLLKGGDMFKFLSILDPTKNNEVDVDIKYEEENTGQLNVQASLFHQQATYLKLKARFIVPVAG